MPLRPDDAPLRWSAASRSVVEQVHELLGFEWVAVTRKRDGELVLLQSHDELYGLPTGAALSWEDSMCARSHDGRAPRITPDLADQPSLLEAAASLGIDTGAWISLPLRGEDGELLGTLCALSPRVHDPGLHDAAPVLEAFAGVLAALLSAEL